MNHLNSASRNFPLIGYVFQTCQTLNKRRIAFRPLDNALVNFDQRKFQFGAGRNVKIASESPDFRDELNDPVDFLTSFFRTRSAE